MAKIGDFDFYCEEAISGKTEVEKIYESDEVLAFWHTRPVYEEHVVVIPKKHIHDLAELRNEDTEILNEIVKVCRVVMKGFEYKEKGGRVVTNLGIFQETPHLHFHVICGEKIR